MPGPRQLIVAAATAVLAILAADAPRAQHTVEIHVNWKKRPGTLPDYIKRIAIKDKAVVGKGGSTVLKSDRDALFGALQSTLRQEFTARNTGIAVVDPGSLFAPGDDAVSESKPARVAVESTLFASKKETANHDGDFGKIDLRVLEVVCTLELATKSTQIVSSYTKTISVTDRAHKSFIPGVGKKETTADFPAEMKVLDGIVKRQARAWVNTVLGFPRIDSFTLRNVSDDCKQAADAYNAGDYKKAVHRALAATGKDMLHRKHSGLFLMGLAFAALKDKNSARKHYAEAIRLCGMSGIDSTDYELALQYLDLKDQDDRYAAVNETGTGEPEIADLLSEPVRDQLLRRANADIRELGLEPTRENVNAAVKKLVEDAVRKHLGTGSK